MRYSGESDMTRMMGIGYVGEVRQGPDGNHFQFVQGVDGLGNPVGSWWKRLARRALPLVRHIAPFVPGGAAAMTVASPFLKRAGIAGAGGLGQFYQAPDGALYQMQGVAQDDALHGFAERDGTPLMGAGYLGEVRETRDGRLYQWVQGIDGLGNAVGSWKQLRRLARSAITQPLVAALQPMLPVAQAVAPAPVVAPPPAPVPTEVSGIGALYQAADGSLFQGVSENELQGLDDDASLLGLAADDDLQGLDDDPELRGFAADEELRGIDDDADLHGIDDDAELRGIGEDAELTGIDDGDELLGFAADQDMQGVDGYVRQDGVNGLEAYVQPEPPQTRAHVRPAQSPEMWKPLW